MRARERSANMTDNNKEERDQIHIIPAQPGFNLLVPGNDDGIYRQPIIAWRVRTTSGPNYCVASFVDPVVALLGSGQEYFRSHRQAIEHPDGRCSCGNMQFEDADSLLDYWQEQAAKREREATKRRQRLSRQPGQDIVSIDGSGIPEMC
jgi:hypothetical protein